MEEEISQKGEKPRMHGCLKGCLIFLAVCVVIFAVGAAVFYHKREAIARWGVVKIIDETEAEFIENLPEDVDKEKVKGTLTRLRNAIAEEKLSLEDVEKILPEFTEAMQDEKLDADEIEHLLQLIDEVLAKEEPVEAESP